jgi:hypothetical protein
MMDLKRVVSCCREWTVYVGYPVGSCGLCGRVPTGRVYEDVQQFLDDLSDG